MDLITYALCRKLIKRSIESLGDIFTLKGNVDSVQSLPSTGNKAGDIYLVGPHQDGSYDEYYWTSNNNWEIMGSTGPGFDGVITEETMYKGEDGTGTIENPAEGTILDVVNSKVLKTETWGNQNWENGTIEIIGAEPVEKIAYRNELCADANPRMPSDPEYNENDNLENYWDTPEHFAEWLQKWDQNEGLYNYLSAIEQKGTFTYDPTQKTIEPTTGLNMSWITDWNEDYGFSAAIYNGNNSFITNEIRIEENPETGNWVLISGEWFNLFDGRRVKLTNGEDEFFIDNSEKSDYILKELNKFKKTQGKPNGLATLDENGRISQNQLPITLENSPLKTVRGDYLVIEDNANPYIYDVKIVNRKTSATTEAGTLVPLESTKPGAYQINFVNLTYEGFTEDSKASSSNNFTFSKIKCGEKWMLKGTIASSYYIPTQVKVKFYDINENFISEKDLTYADNDGTLSAYANGSRFYFKDIETPKRCSFVEFSIPSKTTVSSPVSGKQYFEIDSLYWQKDYTDIKINNYNIQIKTLPLQVPYEMYGLQKEGERRTKYSYSDDYGRITGWVEEQENFYYSYDLKNQYPGYISLNDNIFSVDLWNSYYYTLPQIGEIVKIKNVCSNYYLPVNSINELQDKTFCIVPTAVSSYGGRDRTMKMTLYVKDTDFSSVEDFLTFCRNNNIVVSFQTIPHGETPQQSFYQWRYGDRAEDSSRASFTEFYQKIQEPLLYRGSGWGKIEKAPWNNRYGDDTFKGQYTLVYATGPDNAEKPPLIEITYYQNISHTVKDIQNQNNIMTPLMIEDVFTT